MCIARSMCDLTYVTVADFCSSCSLQKYLEHWPAALNEAGRSVLMLMKGPKIPRIELGTVHLYQHYSLFVHNKLQYTWRGDYCECVQAAQLPVLTWGSSSVPPGTTSMIRSPLGLRGIQQSPFVLTFTLVCFKSLLPSTFFETLVQAPQTAIVCRSNT